METGYPVGSTFTDSGRTYTITGVPVLVVEGRRKFYCQDVLNPDGYTVSLAVEALDHYGVVS
jgi:hypothetical protein